MLAMSEETTNHAFVLKTFAACRLIVHSVVFSFAFLETIHCFFFRLCFMIISAKWNKLLGISFHPSSSQSLSLFLLVLLHFVCECSWCEIVIAIRLEANTCEIYQQKPYMLLFNAYSHYTEMHSTFAVSFIRFFFQLPGANNSRLALNSMHFDSIVLT